MALITGMTERIHAVAMALKSEGFDALPLDTGQGGETDELSLSPGSVDCYVQLARSPASWGGPGPVGAGTLVQRVDAVASVSPLLAPDAAVLLVADEAGWDAPRLQALAALAGAAAAERAGSGVRVAVVDGAGTAGDIAAAARRERSHAMAASLADLSPGLGYADWRDEVLSLTSGSEPTYFGWRRPDGSGRVAVLRRSVLTPLGGAGEGAHRLARAVLADALGAPGTSGGDDLGAWADELAGAFATDVLAVLPDEGFELRMRDVAGWVVRRGLTDSL